MKNKSKDLPVNFNEKKSNVGSGWKLDKILIFIGAVGLIFAFFMDTSVLTESGGRVNNLGLMNDKQNYLIISGILLSIGVILNISNKRNIQNHIAETAPDENQNKTCPYCAEKIKLQAKICRFCNRDQDIE